MAVQYDQQDAEEERRKRRALPSVGAAHDGESVERVSAVGRFDSFDGQAVNRRGTGTRRWTVRQTTDRPGMTGPDGDVLV